MRVPVIYRISAEEQGVSLIETLLALVLFSVMGLGLAYSSMTALNSRGRNIASSTFCKLGNAFEQIGLVSHMPIFLSAYSTAWTMYGVSPSARIVCSYSPLMPS